jgi:folate-dependent phosphoribosylglycinamide formyltransferase PurN
MYGERVHRAVLASGATESGCTVHFVTSDVDAGPAVMQATVPVLPGDTPASLAQRVAAQEHRIYPEAIRIVAERMRVAGRG